MSKFRVELEVTIARRNRTTVKRSAGTDIGGRIAGHGRFAPAWQNALVHFIHRRRTWKTGGGSKAETHHLKRHFHEVGVKLQSNYTKQRLASRVLADAAVKHQGVNP